MPQESISYFLRNAFSNTGQPSSGRVRPALPVRRDVVAIAAILLLSLAVFFILPPIPQNQSYHNFADKRPFFGIPYFFNVISNLGFLWIGREGLRYLNDGNPPNLPNKRMYKLFFGFVFLGGIGSALYHLWPNNATLFWDRLPMIIAIMALVSVIAGECINFNLGKNLLWPLVGLASFTVVQWEFTEFLGRGDMRAYAFAQILPVLFVPLMLLKQRDPPQGDIRLWKMVLLVGVARVAEFLDWIIFLFTFHLVSGHTIKHIALTLGVYEVFLHMKEQKAAPVEQKKRE